MAETKRLSDRNKLIQELLTDGKGLKNFYRFVAQNPHINLHDACQIVINRPNVSVCFLFSEWNEMERRIIKGRKGIPYYDENGNKRFAFDKNDTWGKEYRRAIYPMGRLLKGLQSLRIFATSGLYRPEKSDAYYEGTAIKAVRDTISRYTSSKPTPKAPKPVKTSGKDGK